MNNCMGLLPEPVSWHEVVTGVVLLCGEIHGGREQDGLCDEVHDGGEQDSPCGEVHDGMKQDG